MCHDLDPKSDECQGLFTCTLFKYILYLICKCMSGLPLLTLTYNNLIHVYLGALIGVAHSIVNKKKNIYSDFTFQKLMLSTFTKTFILF